MLRLLKMADISKILNTIHVYKFRGERILKSESRSYSDRTLKLYGAKRGIKKDNYRRILNFLNFS